jgi:hypothetical protein
MQDYYYAGLIGVTLIGMVLSYLKGKNVGKLTPSIDKAADEWAKIAGGYAAVEGIILKVQETCNLSPADRRIAGAVALKDLAAAKGLQMPDNIADTIVQFVFRQLKVDEKLPPCPTLPPG